jgi:hypothetical protein
MDYGLGWDSNDEEESNYRLRNALKVPRATTYTAQALYGEPARSTSFVDLILVPDQIHASDINLEPEYQRGLWSILAVSH